MDKNAAWPALLAVMALACLGVAFAEYSMPIHRVEAAYTINPDFSVNVTLDYIFSQAINESIIYELDFNITNLSITDGELPVNFTIAPGDNKYLINFSAGTSLLKMVVNYLDYGDVLQKDTTQLFYTSFFFDATVSRLNLKVNLPPGYAVYNKEYSPPDATIGSEGESISVSWSESNVDKSTAYSIRFFDPSSMAEATKVNEEINSTVAQITAKNTRYSILYVLTFTLALIAIAGAIFYVSSSRLRKAAESNLLTGFREDEQKIILYIRDRKEVWQNRMRHDFSLSRAKATRVIKKLEKQGLVRKEGFGKSNKIYWLK
jgi:uncharacterized membrane protein